MGSVSAGLYFSMSLLRLNAAFSTEVKPKVPELLPPSPPKLDILFLDGNDRE